MPPVGSKITTLSKTRAGKEDSNRSLTFFTLITHKIFDVKQEKREVSRAVE